MSMQQPARVQRGDVGERAVELFFLELQWGPLPTGVQDLGTDLFVQMRDATAVDLRLMLGVQVKTGDSWFDNPATVNGTDGWWFKESTKAHAEYWMNHHVPHIIVLQSEDRSTRVWAFLTRDTIIDTGMGFKVFVPSDQTLDPEWRDRWISYASESRVRPALEGSRWTFSLGDIPTTDWARFALLAPRLVAPHPNKGFSADLSWPEAVALCVQAESERWDYFAENRASVPSSDDAKAHNEAGWRLAAAIRQWIDEGSIQLLEAFDSGDNAQLNLASSVCRSVAYFDRLDFERSLAVIESVISDELSVNQVWLTVHRGRILAETGHVQLALELFARANVQVASVAADVTVSALRSSILWSLFDLSDRESVDLSAVVPGMDTTTSWWRTQSVVSGLESWTRRVFRTWGRDRAKRFATANTAHNELFSASLIARLAGDNAGYRSAASFMAMADLAAPADLNPSVKSSLETLRETGSEEELKLAIGRVRDEGPLADLAAAIASIRPETVTHTSWRADLVALQVGGGLYPKSQATALLDFLIGVVEDPQPFERNYGVRVGLSGLLPAIDGLSAVLSPAQSERIIAYALALDHNASQVQERPLGALLRDLDPSILKRHEADFRARSYDTSLPQWLRVLYAEHVRTNHEAVRPLLLAGDVRALNGVREIQDLQHDEALALLSTVRDALAKMRYDANGVGIGGPDMAQLALQIGKFCSVSEGIEIAIEFVADPDALRAPKRTASKWLAQEGDLIGGAWAATLREQLPRVISETRYDPSADLLDDFGGAGHLLLLSLLSEDDAARNALEAELITGNEQMRFDACDYYSRRRGSEPVLLALSRDVNYRVSHRAILALSHLVANTETPEQPYLNALARFAEADGESNALFMLGGLESTPIKGTLREIVVGLTDHASAKVRARAHAILRAKTDPS